MNCALLWIALAHSLSLCIGIVYAQTSRPIGSVKSSSLSEQLTACRVQVGTDKEIINLEPLARKDGQPRFVTAYNFSNHPWNYSFNPCEGYSIPQYNPHTGFGDGCHSVSVCKYALEHQRYNYYTLGIHANANFLVSMDAEENMKVELVYRAIKSMRSRSTVINLVCDKSRAGLEDGLFKIVSDTGRGILHAELHHQCCCLGGCQSTEIEQLNAADPVLTGLGASNGAAANQPQSQDGTSTSRTDKKDDGGKMLVIIGTLVAILMVVALIGGLCYIKRSQPSIYSKLPLTGKQNSSQVLGLRMKSGDVDDRTASLASKKVLPVLEDTMIHLESLEIRHRLGGGIFGDTHLATWKEMTVAVKRLTLLVHENQITPEAMKLMKNEVWFLSHQRHRNIVSILGLCLDGKLPSIITEYVTGECLKDFLKTQGHLLSWSHRIRICSQVADGMTFLHSKKPPIIHRDLRCGNLFLLDNDVIKVADFGLIKMLQPIREECPQDDCCCHRTMSACPASIRWTAPELLANPVDKEYLVPSAVKKKPSSSGHKPVAGASDTDSLVGTNVIAPACDVYSFAMVMWELPMCQDPFVEMSTESEIIKIVINGGRPETPPSADMMPQYKELMKCCWDQVPSSRPAFRHIATRLKDLGSPARSYQKQLQSQLRRQKFQAEG